MHAKVSRDLTEDLRCLEGRTSASQNRMPRKLNIGDRVFW